jgi:hypothetical protein
MAKVRCYFGGVSGRTFKALFCERFGCPDSEYEERALKACLYTHTLCLAPALGLFKSNLFAEDFSFVGHLGRTTEWQKAKLEVLRFQDSNHSGGFLWRFIRTCLRVRASGRKASVLAGKLFAREPDWRGAVANALEEPPVSSTS